MTSDEADMRLADALVYFHFYWNV